MSNTLMMRYAASRNGERHPNEYDGAESRRMPDIVRDTYRPIEPEMRRRRDSRGRYMEDEDERRMGLYDGENMGFAAERSEPVRSQTHTPHGRHMVSSNGRFWMQPNEEQNDKSYHEKKALTREAAQRWVDGMVYADENGKTHHGGKWSMAEVKPFAGKMGIPIDGEEFYEFFAMMNAMYADYMAVARRYGVTSPEFYAGLAKAWLDDPDAVDGKTMLYYDCIVKK